MIKPYARAFLVFAITLSGVTQATQDQSMSKGAPGHTDVLGRQSFLPVELRQLSQAQLWYLNYDHLRKRGIKVPPAGIADPKFAQWYLNQNAYQTPGPDDRAEMFTEKTKTAFADYYGGEGNHGVMGSGRATLNGMDQHKGNLTPMVPNSHNDPNLNGAQQIVDGMEEAVWSEILANEFKYGSNETFDVIWTGNYARHHSSGQIFPRGLQGRTFAVRIAHFMLRPGPIDKQDFARVKSIMPKLIDALPYANDVKPKHPGEALRAGLLEFTAREAHTQAEYYAKRLYFGSDSPSNMTIKGERKDLTMHSAFLGYSRIYRKISDGLIPFGTTDEALLTFKELAQSLSKTLPKNMLPYLPTEAEFVEHFQAVYEKQKRIEMVRLTGLPHELMKPLESSSSFKKLGELILRVSKAGNDHNVMLDFDGIKYTDRYQTNKMLIDLGSQRFRSAQEAETRLQKWIPDDASLRRQLASAYFAARSEAKLLGRDRGLTAEALDTYIKEASRMRNQDRSELVLSHERIKRFWNVADEAITNRNGAAAEKFIQRLVDRNTFTFKDAAAFHVVVKQTRKPAEGLIVREVYDAVKAKYSTIVRVNVANGEGYLKGKKLSTTELSRSSLRYGDRTVGAKQSGDYIEFELEGVRAVNMRNATLLKVSDPATKKPFGGAKGGSCRAVFARAS